MLGYAWICFEIYCATLIILLGLCATIASYAVHNAPTIEFSWMGKGIYPLCRLVPVLARLLWPVWPEGAGAPFRGVPLAVCPSIMRSLSV